MRQGLAYHFTINSRKYHVDVHFDEPEVVRLSFVYFLICSSGALVDILDIKWCPYSRTLLVGILRALLIFYTAFLNEHLKCVLLASYLAPTVPIHPVDTRPWRRAAPWNNWQRFPLYSCSLLSVRSKLDERQIAKLLHHPFSFSSTHVMCSRTSKGSVVFLSYVSYESPTSRGRKK